jgi:hypothetical protein
MKEILYLMNHFTERLASVLNRFEEDLAAGAIISVSACDFRVRQLPI